MNYTNFSKALAGLTPRRAEVLLKVLAGKKDKEIASELNITKATVRKHIADTCVSFGLSSSEERGSSHRSDLFSLFTKYRPDLINTDREDTDSANCPKILISYYQGNDLDKSLALELESALKASSYDVFIVNGSLRMAAHGFQQIYAELNQCDYLLLLLSTLAASSEMVTEEVRWAKALQDTRPDSKPRILPIRINCPSHLLNHDLRGYLRGMPQREWRSPNDTPTLVQGVLEFLASGDHPIGKSSSFALAPEPAGESFQFPNPYSLTPNHPPQPVAEPELPMGQVELASAFYMERPGIDQRCYEAIAKPGALIRIKAPRQMGKTSLMARILQRGTLLGYRTVPLSFQLADSKVFADLDQFLQWFCAVVALELQLPARLSDYWNGIFGSKVSCKSYFERYLLANITEPLVLGLDEVDRVLQYPELTSDFFGLLRAWHEEAKNREIWRKLRLVVVHSTEVYIPLDMNQSPFNAGVPVELLEFDKTQIQDLVCLHDLNWNHTQVEELMRMIGGHPYLVRLAMYKVSSLKVTLEQLLQEAATEAGIYSNHLRRQLETLQKCPELALGFKKVVTLPQPIELDSMQIYKLHSMGLVQRHNNNVTPRCNLYREYFCRVLA